MTVTKNLLQALLAEYASDGEWDSTSASTLDSERSMQILARYQSSNPDLFLLHWVRYANLCGAKKTTITLDNNLLLLHHDGTWPTLPNYLVFWGQERANERALAFCLWNALRFRFTQARLYQGNRCIRLDKSLQGRLEEGVKSSWDNLLALTLPPPKKKGDTKGPHFPLLGEEQVPFLSERCAYSPLSISYLGKAIPQAPQVPCAIHAFFRGSHDGSGVRWPSVCDQEPRPQSVKDAYFASVYVGVRDGREGLRAVLDGVAYPSLAPWGLPGLLIVLTTADMHLDISGEQLVRTKSMEHLAEWLVRDLDLFFRRTIGDIDRAPAGLEPYLEALISVRLRAGDYKSAYEICRWVSLKISANRTEFFNAWQRANFFYRFALVSVLMNDPHGAKTLVKAAEKAWAEAPMTDARFMPKAVLPEGELTREERILFCRLAVEEQTLENGVDKVRPVLLEQSEVFLHARRWNLVFYCQRWLLEIEPVQKGKRKSLATRRAMVGVALLNHLRQKSMPVTQDWYEAQIYLNQALRDWRSQLDRQSAIGSDDRATLLDIIDAHVHIHVALGQWEGARRMAEVWLDEQTVTPDYQVEQCLDHLRRLRGLLGSNEAAEIKAIDKRMKAMNKAVKEERGPARDLFARIFGRRSTPK